MSWLWDRNGALTIYVRYLYRVNWTRSTPESRFECFDKWSAPTLGIFEMSTWPQIIAGTHWRWTARLYHQIFDAHSTCFIIIFYNLNSGRRDDASSEYTRDKKLVDMTIAESDHDLRNTSLDLITSDSRVTWTQLCNACSRSKISSKISAVRGKTPHKPYRSVCGTSSQEIEENHSSRWFARWCKRWITFASCNTTTSTNSLRYFSNRSTWRFTISTNWTFDPSNNRWIRVCSRTFCRRRTRVGTISWKTKTRGSTICAPVSSFTRSSAATAKKSTTISRRRLWTWICLQTWTTTVFSGRCTRPLFQKQHQLRRRWRSKLGQVVRWQRVRQSVKSWKIARTPWCSISSRDPRWWTANSSKTTSTKIHSSIDLNDHSVEFDENFELALSRITSEVWTEGITTRTAWGRVVVFDGWRRYGRCNRTTINTPTPFSSRKH